MTLTLTASDVSGQKQVRVSGISADCTVGEFVTGLVKEMELPRNDSGGQPLSYQALLDREGRHLHPSTRIGDEVSDQDELVLQPNIDAGGQVDRRVEV